MVCDSYSSSQATGSPGLQMGMNHSLEAWHTPQVKGTSSLKSLRKRPLPSLPAKPEWRAKVIPRETARQQDWLAPGPSCPSRKYASGEGGAALLLAIFLGSINTLKTFQPIPTFASGLVFPESVSTAEN